MNPNSDRNGASSYCVKSPNRRGEKNEVFPGRKILRLAVFILGVAPLSVPLMSQSRSISPGKADFEKAYSLENSDPNTAAEFYESALSKGLDPELKHAARWRLFYVYRNTGQHAKAYFMLDSFGTSSRMSSVREGLKKDMQKDWRVDEKTVDLYLEGLDAFREGEKDRGVSLLNRALDRAPGSSLFRREVVERFTAEGQQAEAARVASRSKGATPSESLLGADLKLNGGDPEGARDVAMGVATGDPGLLKEADLSHIPYILGRVERENGNLEKTVEYFRTAARYATGDEANRMNALAAYSLYRAGYRHQAYLILDPVSQTRDRNVLLLRDILRVEEASDNTALQELRTMRNELLEDRKKGRGGFLVNRALEVMDRAGKGP